MLIPEFLTLHLKSASAVAAGLLLASCAGPRALPLNMPDLSLPRTAHIVEYAQGKPVQDSVLVTQQEQAGAQRWSLFDPLGLPLARQILQDGRWRNDGFLPPNAAAQILFSALIFAWTPESELASAYPAGSWNQAAVAGGGHQRQLRQNGNVRWTITWQANSPADTFSIHTADGAQWLVSPLKEAL